MNTNFLRNIALAASIALTVSGCGGGGGGPTASGGTGGTGIVSTGVMLKGSIKLNGVHFEDTTANITIDDTVKNPIDLKDGMVVKVRGRINDDRVNGTAERVEVENEVRGTVQSPDAAAIPPRFVVIAQTVLVDDQTIFANFTPTPVDPVAAVTALAAGTDVVEVHGQRDGAGNIRASRVELLTAPGANIDELRGTIKPMTLVPGASFTLQNGGAPDVNVVLGAGFTITPAGAALVEGALVEIHGGFSGTVFTATRIDLEDLEDDEFEPAENEEFEVEGFVAGCTIPCGNTFTVNGRAVERNSSTRYENGTKDDVSNSAKVEVEGNLVGGTLLAKKIQFKRSRVILTGYPTALDTVTRQITLLNKTIQVLDTGLTEIRAKDGDNGQGNDSSALTDIRANVVKANADRIEVRGYLSGSVVIAERIEEIGTSGGDRDVVQARVDTEDEGAKTLVLLGTITANLSTTFDANIQGIDDQTLPGGKAAFFSAVVPASTTPPGTLVKVKGAFTGGTDELVVEEAELEN